MEGSPYQKFSFSWGKGAVLGTGPGVLRTGEMGFLLAGIMRTGVPSSGDPEAGVLPGASLRQDIAPVILRSRVPLRPEPHSEPGGGPGLALFEPPVSCRKGGSSGLLMAFLETVEPGALMFPEEEFMC
ncbi:hypothetical protein DY000_02021593 [Brassica cretica]|uniref:Uncharacterized protein n=1 Tax=Brassica cretica TaxID=69181 RepID=A0ABQ7E2E0_BRACR|nr:hypothetical protein DY000_02021593 [Brassica cretica]